MAVEQDNNNPDAQTAPVANENVHGDHHLKLYYRANQRPPWGVAFLFGVQQIMVCASGLLVMPFLVSSALCAGAAVHYVRVQLISATLVTTGIATIMQTLLGLRLAVLQGPSFAFLPPIFALNNIAEFQCDYGPEDDVPEEIWKVRMQTIQGALICSSIVEFLIGATGCIGVITSHMGPLTIAPLMVLLMLSTIEVSVNDAEKHWISLVLIALLILIAFYLSRLKVPVPLYRRDSGWRLIRVPVFTLFPYLLAIGISWLICVILTATDLEPVGGAARTDKNASMEVLREAPWFRVPYPGQFGWFRFHPGVFCGFFASSLASIVESVGDYHACARISQEPPPPRHAVNRGIMFEAIGCLISGVLGIGVGITSYSENIGVLGITRVASRTTLVISGILVIFLGVFTKFGAILSTIPEPLVGGILTVSIAMVSGVGMSSVQLVDLKITRNCAILGLAISFGMSIPLYFERNPLNTGITTLDQALNILLTIRMFVGGLVGFLLDNTLPGATRAERGLRPRKSGPAHHDGDVYNFPSFIQRILDRVPLCGYLPFCPDKGSRTVADAVDPASYRVHAKSQQPPPYAVAVEAVTVQPNVESSRV